jgi:hypothetical protein
MAEGLAKHRLPVIAVSLHLQGVLRYWPRVYGFTYVKSLVFLQSLGFVAMRILCLYQSHCRAREREDRQSAEPSTTKHYVACASCLCTLFYSLRLSHDILHGLS